MNNELKKEIDSLINKIEESDIYKEYISLREKVSINSDICNLTKEIKIIEKELVRKPSIQKEKELDNLNKELNEIPLYIDYKEALDELNNMLLIVKNKMDTYVSELTINE